MIPLILLCIASVICLLWLLRKNRISLGLPVAYLFSLLLIHVPGAFAHVVGGDSLPNSDLVEVSMRFTAIGSICFVLGVVCPLLFFDKDDSSRSGPSQVLLVLFVRRLVCRLRLEFPKPNP